MLPIHHRYLQRLGLSTAPEVTLAGLAELHLRHLIAVPFENIDVWLQRPVHVDPLQAMSKIVDDGRGGWCFELNAAFAELLKALGFHVLVLGAATLFEGPNDVVDHMVLEVHIEQAYLVDIGFGKHSPMQPLPLQVGVHSQPHETYEFLASPKGLTLAVHDDDKPRALCRFKRVAHDYSEFRVASDRLRHDPATIFRQSPFATRLLSPSGDRITWSDNTLTVTGPDGQEVQTAVEHADRATVLECDFGLRDLVL